MELICFKCQTKNSVSDKVARKDECSSCGMDLHSCHNCHFYDEKVYNSCKEPAADVVKDKERSNFCDFYQPNTGAGQKGDKTDQLKAAAEALFKK